MNFFERLYDPDDMLLYRSFGEKPRLTSGWFRHHHLGDYPPLRNKTRDHFFGVCPRFASQDYDRAWQIRKVPVLWADLDWPGGPWELDWSAYELPTPTYVIASGSGCHAYWKLKKAFEITDVGDPEPVPAGTQIQKGLSPQAQQVQDLLRRIAKACRGDHTHDLARILRVPGTYNNKFDPPHLCGIWQYTDVEYSFDDFQHLPQVEEIKFSKSVGHVSADDMPAVVQLAILHSAYAYPGERSEADFKTCRIAAQCGIGKDTLWQAVKNIGKFGERGYGYFSTTYDRAAVG